MRMIKEKMNVKYRLLKYYEKYMVLMGAAGHLLFIFQTQKIISNKSAADISLIGFFIAFLSILSWFIYGFLKGDKVLIKVNIVGLISSTMCLISILLMS
jgi:uncharacterized protein with PQ loop repeat